VFLIQQALAIAAWARCTRWVNLLMSSSSAAPRKNCSQDREGVSAIGRLRDQLLSVTQETDAAGPLASPLGVRRDLLNIRFHDEISVR